jgi:hypothetical protein
VIHVFPVLSIPLIVLFHLSLLPTLKCALRLGHNRGICYVDMGPNATKLSPVCQCDDYGGWQFDDWCSEAKCTFGPTGCSVRSWTYAPNAVLVSLIVAIVTGTFLYGLSVGVSGRKMCRRNVLTTVLLCTLGAAAANCLFIWAVFAATVVPDGTHLPLLLIQKPVAIPMFAILHTFSGFSFPLM